MMEDQGLSTQENGRSPMRDNLGCGCEVSAQARIDTLVSTRTTQSRKGNRQEHGCVKLPEQWRKLKTREQKRKAEDAKRIRGIVHENNEKKRLSHVQNEMENSRTTVSRNCSACGKGIGMTTLAGGLIRNCAPRQDVKQWSTTVAARCTRESPEWRAHARRRGHPSRQDGRRLTRDNQRVAKEYKSHARPEFYASTPPLEALEVVLSEMSTGGGKGCATGRCAKGVLPCSSTKKSIRRTAARKNYQAGDENTCGLLQYSSYGTRDAAQNWEVELASALSDLKLTRGIACPSVWQGCIKD